MDVIFHAGFKRLQIFVIPDSAGLGQKNNPTTFFNHLYPHLSEALLIELVIGSVISECFDNY